jgi:hypothetical protein
VSRPQQRAPGKRQDGDERDRHDQEAAPIEQGLGHVANCDNESVTCP